MIEGRSARRAERRRDMRRKPAKKGNPWIWVLAVMAVAIVVVVVVALTVQSGDSLKGIGQPVPANTMDAITKVPASVWTTVGATGATKPIAVTPFTSSDAPGNTVLYMGAEYCPYCAVERWPLVVALSRFGTFGGLKLSASSSVDVYPNTPTFTFHGANYTSDYIKLEAVETASREVQNGQYATLETPTLAQRAVVSHFNAPPYVPSQSAGAIPFLLVGERYMWSGAGLSVGLIQNMTWEEIPAKLSDPQDNVGRAIVANANMITAAICKLDGGQPVDVCSNPGVQAAAGLLPASSGQ